MLRNPTPAASARQFGRLSRTPGLPHQPLLTAGMRLWGLKAVMRRFCVKTKMDSSGCLNWIGALDRGGYGRFVLDGKERLAHRVAWRLAFGPIPPGRMVRHQCHNPQCVNPAHLLTGSAQDNSDDMTSALRGRSKLTNGDAATIIGGLLLGFSLKEIALEHGVSVSTISHIKQGARRTEAVDRELEKSPYHPGDGQPAT
jgi:HNH endonuclease